MLNVQEQQDYRGTSASTATGVLMPDASLPPGPELYAANRRLAAYRNHWPDGALEACEKLDAEHPGWSIGYRHVWREHPAGFYALHDGHEHNEHQPYGATPEGLDASIREHRCRRWP